MAYSQDDGVTMSTVERPRSAVSRRDVLGAGALVAAFAAAARAQTQRVHVAADVDPSSLLEKLVDRVTFGATQEELTLARSLGYEGYLEYHLNHTAIDDTACDAAVAHLTTIGQSYTQLILQTAGFVRNELVEHCILRAMLSRRQLYQRMVELWSDHFNIDVLTAEWYKTPDDRDVARAHALGTFPALLSASAHSPAMLYYLNNNVSTAGNPNENYARELMELHTLDVTGGYTQQDVQEVARCFTGWQIFNSGTSRGLFRYNNNAHDQGVKTVLGVTIPANGGENDGNTVLSILSNHPSTARFIAFKVCRHFLGYNIASSIIDRVAAVYTATGGDIKTMIRETLRPQHLAAAQPKIKRPFHHFVSALRGLGATVTSTSTMRSRLSEAGNQPYMWQTPDGYPDKLDHWAKNVLVRWNWGASLSTMGISGITYDDVAFYAGATTADQLADRINERLFLGRLPAIERNRLRDYLLISPPTQQRTREAIGLAIGCPTFQWY
jgi:uncharacterized protein (DUF1800 family)